ncbi:hypothetical protein A2246_02015 [candidate division WOR-1 bacterium RIFOXYA2_FULL_37_7]|uniref:Uncharacterized protein n=1 Tax=candidate division WOR-1 bacterium RIFOXYB2_FULL_37_13 TaxID=1802579 RepID=A0A1F4SSV5_UNCSA|nr:MAG: hypothetical protein A2246_02015 [candidate division WOR-1 bacterium RIFOXYA2_FULL_37_7]OGC23510.1 MAG: hypothetical protein A2310_02790 [candidate division WOR-1 bacterium RIFOXYB2_FULL_37_13]
MITSQLDFQTERKTICYDSFDYMEIHSGFPWKYANSTSKIIMLYDNSIIENKLINKHFQKLSEQNLSFWDNAQDEYWNKL